MELPEQFLHHRDMLAVRGADEGVVRDLELLPELLEVPDEQIGMLLGGPSPLLRRFLHFLAVLVRAREKEDRIAQEAMIARQHVRRDRGVGVADVRYVVHVVDGSRYVELLWHR
jgi:hypothetical protein